MNRAAATLIALTAVTTVAAPAVTHAACRPAKHTSLASVMNDAVAMQRLLSAEQLTAPSTGTMSLLPVELDANSKTKEAIITLISPEHCHLTGCVGIVVQLEQNGAVKALGHGRMLAVSAGTSGGYTNLLAANPHAIGKFITLSHCYGRYRPGACNSTAQAKRASAAKQTYAAAPIDERQPGRHS